MKPSNPENHGSAVSTATGNVVPDGAGNSHSRPALESATTRRQFLRASAWMGGSVWLAGLGAAPAVRAADTDRIKIGIIGCGGRGAWIAGLFAAHGGYDVVACADYFQDKVDALGQKLNIDPSRRFTTLSGYKKLLECKLDAVAIETPPYFHPEQAAAAIDAGKHVYLAKPLAVDVPGCRTITETARKAREKKRAMLVDFQHRANPFYQETIKRVHEGAIGTFTYGEAFNQCDGLSLQVPPGTPEARLRNWIFDIALSGDPMVEINIHTLDVMNWIFQKPPLSVVGSGGRKVVHETGDCWDHCGLMFQYADGVPVTFTSKRYKDGAENDKHLIVNVYGTEGRVNTKYGGREIIMGKNFYAGGTTGGLYKEGVVSNIATFHKQVTTGDFQNPTVEPSVQSNLIAIMGRTAAFKRKLITWDDIKGCNEKLDAKLDGLKS